MASETTELTEGEYFNMYETAVNAGIKSARSDTPDALPREADEGVYAALEAVTAHLPTDEAGRAALLEAVSGEYDTRGAAPDDDPWKFTQAIAGEAVRAAFMADWGYMYDSRGKLR